MSRWHAVGLRARAWRAEYGVAVVYGAGSARHTGRGKAIESTQPISRSSSPSRPGPNNRIPWIDTLRWWAAFGVVVGHALDPLAGQSMATGHLDPAWVLSALLRYAVPVFFFLSGLVQGVSARSVTSRSLIRQILRAGIPYIVFSTVYTVLAVILGHASILDARSLVTQVLLARNAQHLWFLASLAVIGPVGVVLWSRFKRRFAYAAISIGLVAAGWYSYSMALHGWASSLARLVLVPLGIYAAGLWWSQRRKLPIRKTRHWVWPVLAAFFLALSVVEMYLAEVTLDSHWLIKQQHYAFLAIGAAALCIAVDRHSGASGPGRVNSWLASLPSVTLGVYCLHVAFLRYVPFLSGWQSDSLWLAVLAGLVSLVLAAMLAWLVSKVRLLRRLVL